MGIYDDEFDDFEGDFDDYEGDCFDDGGFDHDIDRNENTSHNEPCCIEPLDWKTIAIIGAASQVSYDQ